MVSSWYTSLGTAKWRWQICIEFKDSIRGCGNYVIVVYDLETFWGHPEKSAIDVSFCTCGNAMNLLYFSQRISLYCHDREAARKGLQRMCPNSNYSVGANLWHDHSWDHQSQMWTIICIQIMSIIWSLQPASQNVLGKVHLSVCLCLWLYSEDLEFCVCRVAEVIVKNNKVLWDSMVCLDCLPQVCCL